MTYKPEPNVFPLSVGEPKIETEENIAPLTVEQSLIPAKVDQPIIEPK